MIIPFVKYQGLGNDFILINSLHSEDILPISDHIQKLCNRYFGIGADGVIVAVGPRHDCDYTMRIFNSDGSETQMCGNGIRCFAKFLQFIEEKENKIPKDTYRIWTGAGVIIPKITADGEVVVDMGEPKLSPPSIIPTTLAPTKENMVLESVLESNGNQFLVTAVSMGNPHCVIFVDSLDHMNPPFPVLGPLLESHPSFPERVNVHFVKVVDSHHVVVKVWERGAGPTLACGTGKNNIIIIICISIYYL